ncbi:YfcC family protein [Vaginisenegalia massiliensis]|uniref:YfcC family protein n=1 Tax=Vaginisenegalia massiliensis TaxID=2058294 RepID=UPI000F534D42|nr:Na+/H+ antiporter NhaC family protein [Vaginisenegalia massiliensis]
MKADQSKKWYHQITMPHVYVLLFSFIVIMAMMSWIVPAGAFVRIMVDGREMIKPGSFHYVKQHGQGIFEILKAFPKGFERGQAISYFLFATGGAFYLINKTGAIEAALAHLVKALKGNEIIVIPIVLFIIGLGGSTIGMSEETIVFIGLAVTLARAMGYDALVGMGMISLGAGLGFTSGFMNPFSVGVAQSIAELPMFSGISLRLTLFVAVWIATVIYLVTYARRVKNDPTTSFVYEEEQAYKKGLIKDEDDIQVGEMSSRQKLIMLVFIGGFCIIGYGVFKFQWFISEIGAVFIGMGLVSAVIGGMSANDIAEGFIEGAKEMLYAALVVGLAQSLVVIMEDGMIMDTIIHGLTGAISTMPSYLAAVGMYFVQIMINFFLSSGTGQAAVTMPIMVPLGDNLEVTRQTTVLAFQLGNGFLDSIMPMSAVLMAQLAIAKIPYKKWFRFALPLMVIWLLIGLVFVLYAQFTHYGPF